MPFLLMHSFAIRLHPPGGAATLANTSVPWGAGKGKLA